MIHHLKCLHQSKTDINLEEINIGKISLAQKDKKHMVACK